MASKNMAMLFIDTHERGVIRLALATKTAHGYKSVEKIHEGRSNNLVALVAKFLERQKVNHLEAVYAVRGPGSFSAIRSGVLAANLFSRIWGIPLYGYNYELRNYELRILEADLIRGYMEPVYDMEPNITVKS